METKNMGNTWGNTYVLLCRGLSQTQIAKKLNLSRKTVWKRTRFYLSNGQIEKIAWGVCRKVTKKCNLPPTKPLANITSPPIMLPSKFGGIFAQTGTPALEYDLYGKAYDEEKEYYSAQFGRHKTQIWLKSGFQGATVEERIDSSHQLILEIADRLSQKYKITLTHLRWYEDIEWIDPSKTRSKETASGAKIKKGERIEVAGAIHKYSDFSHPDQFQINKKVNGEDQRPTEHAKIRERLYSGEYDDTFAKIMSALEAQSKLSTSDRALLHEVVEGFVALRQRFEIENKKR